MILRLVLVLTGTLMTAVPASAANNLHGIALGMTADAILQSAHLGCEVGSDGNVSCTDAGDGSKYVAIMSGAKPPVALTVTRTFCSAELRAAVLRSVLAEFGLDPKAARSDPNGFSFDLGKTEEGLLSSDQQPCKGRGQVYELSIRGNELIKSTAQDAEKPKGDSKP